MSEEEDRLGKLEAIVEGILNSGESADAKEQYGKEEYECESCGTRVAKDQKHCSGCGKPLKWGGQ